MAADDEVVGKVSRVPVIEMSSKPVDIGRTSTKSCARPTMGGVLPVTVHDTLTFWPARSAPVSATERVMGLVTVTCADAVAVSPSPFSAVIT